MFQFFNAYTISILTLSGLILGSFFNMLIYRLPRDLKWTNDRSICPNCEHVLGIKDLVPLLSYCFSLGKCQHCKKPIAWRYPAVELLAIIFLFIAFYQVPDFTWASHFYKLAFFYLVCIGIFFSDLETYIIPNEFSLGLVIVGIVSGFFQGSILTAVYGASLGYGVFWAIAMLAKLYYKKDAMGGGDVKLMAGIGAMWGPTFVLFSAYFSFLFGAVIGIGVLALSKKEAKDRIPFGPMIILAAIFVSLFEMQISSYFLALFY